MGSWGTFYIGELEFETTKSYASESLMIVFRDSDRVVRIEEERTLVSYEASVDVIKQRLELLGFTLRAARQEYQDAEASYETTGDDEGSAEEANESAYYSWSRLADSFDDWLSRMRVIAAGGFSRFETVRDRNDIDPATRDLLRDYNYYGFPLIDGRLLLRAVLEAYSSGTMVRQDLSHFVDGGYYDQHEDICDRYWRRVASEACVASPIVVLTEGTSDRNILRRSIEHLRPHIGGYYRFFDFETSNHQGGAGTVVSLLRGFVGSGVSSRVIALLDNDTAAHEAVTGLRDLRLPENFRLLHYPPIPMLESYPTIGPQGKANARVNGSAGGIELYLGTDVLTDPQNGDLLPVTWRGYSAKLKRYQGEVSEKEQIQRRFWDKLEDARAGTAVPQDWSGLQAILDTLVGAFA